MESFENGLRELPEGVTVPEDSIASVRLYRMMYTAASDNMLFRRLCMLSEEPEHLRSLYAETELQPLVDSGLAARRSGAGDPFIDITSVGEVIVEEGPESGIRSVVEREHEFEEVYS